MIRINFVTCPNNDRVTNECLCYLGYWREFLSDIRGVHDEAVPGGKD